MEIIYNILKADTKSKQIKEIKKLIDEEFIKCTKTEKIYKTSLENIMKADDILEAHIIASSALNGTNKSINDFKKNSNSYISVDDISKLLEKLSIIFNTISLDKTDINILKNYLNERIKIANIVEKSEVKRKKK